MNEKSTQESVSETQTNADIRLQKEKHFLRELIEFSAIVLFIILPIRMFVAQPFIVNGASMDPTFANGQYLIVDQLTYHFKNPLRGSIVIFKYPQNPSKYFIKRIIGLPGETVRIQDGVVTIINDSHKEGFALDEPYIVFEKKDSFEMKLGETEYFVLGDNRYGSADSRSWGALPEKNIVGRPIVRLLPIQTADIFPGDQSVLLNE